MSSESKPLEHESQPVSPAPSSPTLPLPKALLTALKSSPYRAGTARFSVSQLISPPQKRVLCARHREKIELDPGRQLYSLMGSATHDVIESGACEASIAHTRFYGTIQGPADTRESISGEVDLLEQSEAGWTLYDFKNVFVRAAGKPKTEHIIQLNCLAWLCNHHIEPHIRPRIPVQRAAIINVFRDWSAMQALEREDYPKEPYEVVEVPLWPSEAQLDYLQQRVETHVLAENQPDHALPPCSDEERWMSAPRFAVLKTGNIKPRLFDTSTEAAQYVSERKPTEQPHYAVTQRLGRPIRCEVFCEAAAFCHQNNHE